MLTAVTFQQWRQDVSGYPRQTPMKLFDWISTIPSTPTQSWFSIKKKSLGRSTSLDAPEHPLIASPSSTLYCFPDNFQIPILGWVDPGVQYIFLKKTRFGVDSGT